MKQQEKISEIEVMNQIYLMLKTFTVAEQDRIVRWVASRLSAEAQEIMAKQQKKPEMKHG